MFSITIGVLFISFLYAIIPNHWLPVVTIGRKHGWNLAETSRVTFIAGSAHVISTILIGLLPGYDWWGTNTAYRPFHPDNSTIRANLNGFLFCAATLPPPAFSHR